MKSERAKSRPVQHGAYILGGRRFRSISVSTIEHDEEVQRLLKVSGLRTTAMAGEETPEEMLWRTIETLVETNTLRPLLACVIVPEEFAPRRRGWLGRLLRRPAAMAPGPRGWMPALQVETAAFLGDLDDPEDKRRYYELVSELLLPFLRAGVVSWLRSPRSSAGAADAPHHRLTPTTLANASVNGAG